MKSTPQKTTIIYGARIIANANRPQKGSMQINVEIRSRNFTCKHAVPLHFTRIVMVFKRIADASKAMMFVVKCPINVLNSTFLT